MKAAIVLEPTGPLRQMVADAKEWVRATLGDRIYLADPPHSTLLFATFRNATGLQPLIAAVAAAGRPVTLRTTGMLNFENDPLAGGATTVALRIEPTQQLFALQQQIADALRGEISPVPPAVLASVTNPQWRASAERYGFPFVGAHWIPHLTIAALDGRRDAAAIRELMARAANFECTITEIALWEVIDSHATPRATFALGASD